MAATATMQASRYNLVTWVPLQSALLRREGLYSSHLNNWRHEVEAIELATLQSKPRGPKSEAGRGADRGVLSLEQEVAKLK